MHDCFIVDVHTHPYESKDIGIENMAGNGQFGLCGSIGELSEIMRTAGIDVAVQLSVLADRNMIRRIALHSDLPGQKWEKTTLEIAEHIKSRNSWICSNAAADEKLIAFICIDPLMGIERMVSEISEKVEHFGARGLKLFPGLGRYSPDEPLLYPVYETAMALDLPVLSHGRPVPC